MARLFVLSGPDVGKSFEVRSGDTIGRSPECIVTVRHSSVSRKHARLERDGELWYVVDEGSRNGVTIAGERTKKAALADMQEFSLGELLLRFREGSPEPAPAPVQLEEEDEDDDIVLEDPDEIEIEAPPALARTTLASRPAAVARTQDTGFGASAGQAGSELSRGPAAAGERILQYNKVSGGGTFSSSELGQYPLWVRLAVALAGVALAVGIAWVAFRGTSFVKKQVGGSEVEQSG